MTASAPAGKKQHPEACSAVSVLLTPSKQRLHPDPNLEKFDFPRTEQQRSSWAPKTRVKAMKPCTNRSLVVRPGRRRYPGCGGDTDQVAFGLGTMGSRSMVSGGTALYRAADKIIEKASKIAAHMLKPASLISNSRAVTFQLLALTRR